MIESRQKANVSLLVWPGSLSCMPVIAHSSFNHSNFYIQTERAKPTNSAELCTHFPHLPQNGRTSKIWRSNSVLRWLINDVWVSVVTFMYVCTVVCVLLSSNIWLSMCASYLMFIESVYSVFCILFASFWRNKRWYYSAEQFKIFIDGPGWYEKTKLRINIKFTQLTLSK